MIYDTEARNPRWTDNGRKDPEARHPGMKAKAGVNQIKAVFRRQNLHKKSSAWFSMVGDCMHSAHACTLCIFCATLCSIRYTCVCVRMRTCLFARACMHVQDSPARPCVCRRFLACRQHSQRILFLSFVPLVPCMMAVACRCEDQVSRVQHYAAEYFRDFGVRHCRRCVSQKAALVTTGIRLRPKIFGRAPNFSGYVLAGKGPCLITLGTVECVSSGMLA